MVNSNFTLGHSQNHLAVAGGCAALSKRFDFVPTRYREVVLTVSKRGSEHKGQNSVGANEHSQSQASNPLPDGASSTPAERTSLRDEISQPALQHCDGPTVTPRHSVQ